MARKKPGIFISFEGGEGAGKTTQIELLAKIFREQQREIVVTREPGGTPKSDRIRNLLLQHEMQGLEPLAELFLYEASRAQHVKECIEPALKRGAIVLCDRFADSSLVYQGAGRKIERALVERLNTIATFGRKPHVTFVFDLDPQLGLSRIAERGMLDRMEVEKINFHRAIRKGYQQLVKREPQRCFRIDASQDMQAIHRDIMAILRKKRILA